MGAPLVIEARPAVARRLEQALLAAGRPELAAAVPALRLVAACRCDNPACESIWTGRPLRRWYRRGRELDLGDGLAVTVVDGEIVYVEVLDLEALRS